MARLGLAWLGLPGTFPVSRLTFGGAFQCLNLPDTGIQFSANAQLGEAVQRRFAGGAGLQREDNVMEVSLLACCPSNVLDFKLDK